AEVYQKYKGIEKEGLWKLFSETNSKELDSANRTLLRKFQSIHLMEDKLTFYKNDRNEYVSSVDEIGSPFAYNFYQDIILPFIENSLLMDNIAKSEGVKWNEELTQSKLRVRVFIHKNIAETNNKHLNEDDSPYSIPLEDLGIIKKEYSELYAIYDGVIVNNNNLNNLKVDELPYFKQCKSDSDTSFYDKRSLSTRDIEILVPDALGTHAIYSILENQIRNVAKHGDKKAIQEADFFDIIFKIDPVKNDCKNFYVELFSNIPTLSEEDINPKDKEKQSKLQGLKNKLNESLTEDVSAKGIADMRINANKLLFKDAMNLENHEQDPPVLSLDKLPERSKSKNEYKYSLCYKFCLKRSKRLVFVSHNYSFETIDKKNEFKNFGIDFEDSFNWNDFLQDHHNDTHYEFYEIAVVDAEIFKKYNDTPFDYTKNEAHPIDCLLKKLPNKVSVFNIQEDNIRAAELIEQRRIYKLEKLDDIKKTTPEKLYKNIWETWIVAKWGKTINLHLYFDKDEYLTDKYRHALKNFDSKTIQPVLYYQEDEDIKSIPEKVNAPLDNFHVFFDRHGKKARDKFKETIEDPDKKRFTKNTQEFKYSWIYIDKNNKDFDTLATNDLKYPIVSFAKSASNALNKILIIDERAMELALNTVDSKESVIASKKLYGIERNIQNQCLAARVIIPNRFRYEDIDIKKDDRINEHRLCAILDDKKGIQAKLIYKVNNDKEVVVEFDTLKFDTLIIHRTILSKILEKDDQVFKIIQEQFPHILVCTGGGDVTYNDSIMSRITRISYSSVHKYFLKGRVMKNSASSIF
ncbi:MAG: hypothetical protein ACOCQ4_03145, partial [bacterium]